MKIFTPLAPALLCLALGACSDSSTSVVCPGEAAPSLTVNVVDARTGESVTRQASGTWTSGGMSDSLRHVTSPVDSLVLLAAFGPPGTYQVRVARPGHADWIRGDVVVSEGRCGPSSSSMTATLTAVNETVISN